MREAGEQAPEDGGFECAVVEVPLDYDDPEGATIDLAVTRLRATDPAQRIGSLFLNPGGPGGSGVDLVVGAGAAFGALFGPQVRERYDLIGVDPRGIAAGTRGPLRRAPEQPRTVP